MSYYFWITERPCRKCIVRPICKERCEKIQNRWDSGEKIINRVINTMLWIAVVIVLFGVEQVFY